MLFSQEGGRLKITPSTIELVNHTQGTLLFSKECAKLKTNQSKQAWITVQRVQCYFAGEGKTENSSANNRGNSKHGTMLFSLERAEMKITQSKVPLRIHRVQSYFLPSGEN